jgi:hypothetical protein
MESVEEFVALVAEMARFRSVDAIQQGLIVNQLSKLLALPAANVHKLLVAASRSPRARPSPSATPTETAGGAGVLAVPSSGALTPEALRTSVGWDAEQAALVSVLRVLVNEPGYYSDVESVFRPERILDARARRIASALAELCRTVGEFKLWELMDKFEDPADARFLTDLVFEGAQVGNYEATIRDTRLRLERMAPLRRGRQAAEELRRVARSADRPTDGRDDEIERLNRIQQSLAGAHGFAPGIPASALPDS